MLLKGFNLNLNRSNESIKARTVAELHRLADHRDTDTLEEAETLVTKSRASTCTPSADQSRKRCKSMR